MAAEDALADALVSDAKMSARKLDFAPAPNDSRLAVSSGRDTLTPSHDDHGSDIALNSAAAWSRLSVRDELLTQLNGEKLRVTELTAKINEMYRLEEEQRVKARDLANANDRLEGVRDNLQEQLRATQLLMEDLERQSELRDLRVKELEEQLANWMDRHETAMQELYQCRADVAALLDEDAERTAQRDAALAKLEQALSASLRVKNELDACEAEKKGLIKQRQLLQHQRDEMVGKVATLESSVSSFRSELHAMTLKNEEMEQTLHKKDADISHLAALLAGSETRVDELTAEIQELRGQQGCDRVQQVSEEALLADEARRHLQQRVISLEEALTNISRDHADYRSSAESELVRIRDSYEAHLNEYISRGESLEIKLDDYKHRLKALQKSQKNGNSELVAENESLRASLLENQSQMNSMHSQLTLGEQSWVQQAAILKAAMREKSDESANLLEQLKNAEGDLREALKKLAAESRTDPVVPPKTVPDTMAESNQILVLENKIKSLSVNKKWQVLYTPAMILLSCQCK